MSVVVASSTKKTGAARPAIITGPAAAFRIAISTPSMGEPSGSLTMPFTRAPAVIDFFFQAEDGIRARTVTGVQTCALPIPRLASHGGDDGGHRQRRGRAGAGG